MPIVIIVCHLPKPKLAAKPACTSQAGQFKKEGDRTIKTRLHLHRKAFH